MSRFALFADIVLAWTLRSFARIFSLPNCFGKGSFLWNAIQVLKKAPESYEALFRLTRLWRLAKRPTEALVLAKAAAAVYPVDVELGEQYADCLK
jgi:hypothetical protein